MSDTTAIADPISERIIALLTEKPKSMTPTIARLVGVPELEVIRRLPGGASVELDIAQWEAIIREFEHFGKVHVICNNGTVVLESFGTFGNFSTWGEFFNVQTKIDMHIRHAELGAVFAVEKPGHMDGQRTLSVQFFTREGSSAFKVFFSFGGKAPSAELEEKFAALRDTYRLARH